MICLIYKPVQILGLFTNMILINFKDFRIIINFLKLLKNF